MRIVDQSETKFISRALQRCITLVSDFRKKGRQF